MPKNYDNERHNIYNFIYLQKLTIYNMKNQYLLLKSIFAISLLFTSCGSDDSNVDEDLDLIESEISSDRFCKTPKNLNVELLEATFLGQNIELTWEAGGEETTWKVDYKSNSVFGNDAVITVEDEPKLIITAIPRLNVADITIWSVCGEDVSSEIIAFDIPGKIENPIVADMDVTIDGTLFENWRPKTFSTFNSAISVVGNFNSNTASYIEVIGNPRTGSILEFSEEVILYINSMHWQTGDYVLKGRESLNLDYDIDSYLRVNLSSSSEVFEQVTKDGTLKITKFDRTNRVIEGEFSFEYQSIDNNNGDVIKNGTVSGVFQYSLDDKEFD